MKRASLGVSIPGLVLMGLFNLLFFAIGSFMYKKFNHKFTYSEY